MRPVTTLLVALLVAAVPALSFAADRKEDDAKQKPTLNIAHIVIKGSYPEGPPPSPLFGQPVETLGSTIDRLKKAAADEDLHGVILRIKGPSLGWAKLNDLRQAILKVRSQGKKVYAWFDGGTRAEYLLATACDEIAMPESAALMLVGIRAEVSFYKTLLDKAGIQADTLRVGKFKSAAEPYTRTEMSPEFRQEMQALLDDHFERMTNMIGEARGLKREQIEAVLSKAPLTAAEAKELGLIDRVVYEDELQTAISKQNGDTELKVTRSYAKKKVEMDFSGLAGFANLMNMLMGAPAGPRRTLRPKIAVIYATGTIMTGRSQTDLLGSTTLGSDTMIKAIRTANRDSTVKAIVLRVNSPGGSALASDLMWRELERVDKPFLVSMGDVAASGGYYIAMGADRIFAEPGTLTGSIGVVGFKIALDGLYNKVGITTSVVTRGGNSGVLSTTNGYTDSERAAMVKLLNAIYEQFTTKAAKGRDMKLDRLKTLAGGRVYTGTQALEVGLVDELGTLEDVIAAAKKQAGLKPDDRVEILQLPKASSPLESLFGPLDPNASARRESAVIRRVLADVSPDMTAKLKGLYLLKLFGRKEILTLMPYQLLVK